MRIADAALREVALRDRDRAEVLGDRAVLVEVGAADHRELLRGRGVAVRHLVELLDEAYRGKVAGPQP